MYLRDFQISSALAEGVTKDDQYLDLPISASNSQRLREENLVAGWYRWRQGPPTKPDVKTEVEYDRFYWSDFQDDQGNVSLGKHAAWFTNGKAKAFRLRCVVEGVQGRKFPAFVPHVTLPTGECVPDWDHPEFLPALDRFLAKFSLLLTRIPLAWVEMGIYGNYGEWHLFGLSGAPEASFVTKRVMLDLHMQHFAPYAELKFMSDAGIELLRWVNQQITAYPLAIRSVIGWRRDSLGTPHFDRISADPYWAEIAAQSACIVELGTKSPSLALAVQQVQNYRIAWVGNGNYKSWATMTAEEKDLWTQLGQSAQRMHRMSGLWVRGSGKNESGLLDCTYAYIHDDDVKAATAPLYMTLGIVGTDEEHNVIPLFVMNSYVHHDGTLTCEAKDGITAVTDLYPVVTGGVELRAHSPNAKPFGAWTFSADCCCTEDDYKTIIARVRDLLKTTIAELTERYEQQAVTSRETAQALLGLAEDLSPGITDY